MRTLLLFAFAIVGLGCRTPENASPDASMTVESQTLPSPKLVPVGPSIPVPRDWPADVPIYPGAHISKARTRPEGDGSTVRILDFETPKELTDVVEFYRTTFVRAKKIHDMNVSMVHALQYELAGETIDIAIVMAMGLTQVTVTVTR